MRDLEVWYARADVGMIERRLGAQAGEERDQGIREERRQGAHEGQHARRSSA